MRFRVEIIAEKEGRKVLDSETARLLKYIDEMGSLLAAVKRLGIPYSKAWQSVARAEAALGIKLVEAKRGAAAGARLTEAGKNLLLRYMEVAHRKMGDLEAGGEACDFVYAGSSDEFMRALLDMLREGGYCAEVHWVGSTAGVLMTALGLADISGIHLLDPVTGEYNLPYIERFGLSNSLALFRGYMRAIGFIYRPDTEFRGVEDLTRYKFINRNPGSGTRALLEHLLEQTARRMGVSKGLLTRDIRGYHIEAATHDEVAAAIAEGRADVGLAIAAVAERYGLAFRQVALERFDIAVNKRSLEKPAVKRLVKLLRSEAPPPGYAVLRSTGVPILNK
ncbi:MAG: LysR family transcriptional regulator [Thermoproteus sp.]|nr:LysR family transcriptional regulator [Thermoproteus sp.]